MELKDANGKIEKILDSKTTEFNIKDFEAGVYFLAIYSVKTKDVIKLVKE